jgi:prepilin-type N-terminal cleavage/methylation domain-containing protein
MKRSKGFTLIELLVVVAIIALLVSILVPSLSYARELTKRALCGANLNGLYKGLAMYYAESNDVTPRIVDGDGDPSASLQMGTECTETDLGEGAQQNLCLLVKAGSVPWKMFLCPSTNSTVAERTADDRKYGFGEGTGANAKQYIDYALQIPYRTCTGTYAGDNPAPWTTDMEGGVPFLGDQGPRSSGTGNPLLEKFSPNHNDKGENLLFSAGNVKWSTDQATIGGTESMNTAGWGDNNIYTADTWSGTNNETLDAFGTSIGLPGSEKDSVLYSWIQQQ